eukprot:3915540-Rhodomonas_salina.3
MPILTAAPVRRDLGQSQPSRQNPAKMAIMPALGSLRPPPPPFPLLFPSDTVAEPDADKDTGHKAQSRGRLGLCSSRFLVAFIPPLFCISHPLLSGCAPLPLLAEIVRLITIYPGQQCFVVPPPESALSLSTLSSDGQPRSTGLEGN